MKAAKRTKARSVWIWRDGARISPSLFFVVKPVASSLFDGRNGYVEFREVRPKKRKVRK
jgi:hypothetical protein